MKDLTFPADLQPVQGTWDVTGDIRIANVQKRDIYLAPTEPSFVAWAILWKESSGDIKLSFAEVMGDLRSWPPAKLFRNNNINPSPPSPLTPARLESNFLSVHPGTLG